MTSETSLTVEERIRQLLQHLGIRQAHVAGQSPEDWTGLATTLPELCASLTLVGPPALDPHAVGRLASRLLVVNGDQGPRAEKVRRAVEGVPGAQLVTLRDYAILGWTDVVADRTEEIGSAMLQFLAHTPPSALGEMTPATAGNGEVAGIAYRIRGAGPPLVLLPLGLFPSQWDPLVSRLSEQYCTITLGGAALGMVAMLESRGRAAGYWAMVRTLLAEVHLRPGESIVEVGCGSGVLTRGLAHSTRGTNRIIGVDINRYLLREATALAEKEGLADTIAFQEGHAHALPFPDQSVDVTLSVTVMEEVDADQMLGEIVRVTKPGGRVAAIVRACDRPFLMNLPLRPALHRKVEEPGGWAPGAEARGCADASLYRRFQQAGLTQVQMFPQWAAFDRSAAVVIQFLQNRLLPTLSPEEAQEWRRARAQAEAEGTFFIAWPHHCAVGIRPS
jgi:ubiquinone/menaquinone biosynthesis C-methylase UbiE